MAETRERERKKVRVYVRVQRERARARQREREGEKIGHNTQIISSNNITTQLHNALVPSYVHSYDHTTYIYLLTFIFLTSLSLHASRSLYSTAKSAWVRGLDLRIDSRCFLARASSAVRVLCMYINLMNLINDFIELD